MAVARSYSANHDWLHRNFGTPKRCRMCNRTRKIDWANKLPKITRKRENWIPLCRSCHRKFDSARTEMVFRAQKKTMTLREWADELGVKYNTLYCRIHRYGWNPARALGDR